MLFMQADCYYFSCDPRAIHGHILDFGLQVYIIKLSVLPTVHIKLQRKCQQARIINKSGDRMAGNSLSIQAIQYPKPPPTPIQLQQSI